MIVKLINFSLTFLFVFQSFDIFSMRKKDQNKHYYKKNNIHVTWATVGMLFNENWEEWFANQPSLLPTYENQKLDPYGYGEQHSKTGLDRFFFAPKLIKAIQSVKGQEIGSHTYSHYYCLEKGQTQAQFDADLQQAVSIANKFSIFFQQVTKEQSKENCYIIETRLPVSLMTL